VSRKSSGSKSYKNGLRPCWSAGLILNHFESDPRGFAMYIDLPDGSYNSFGGRENGHGIGR